jgi:hypothetical protein
MLIIVCYFFVMDAMRTVIYGFELMLSQNRGPVPFFKSTCGLNSRSAIVQREAHIISVCWLIYIAGMFT